MPKSQYFGGHGERVWRDLVRRYGRKKGQSIFYATAKKRGLEPPKKH